MGESYLAKSALFEHDAHRVLGGHDEVEEGLPRPRLAERSVHDLCRRGPPVVDRDAGLFVECFLKEIENVGLHGAVEDETTFFFRRFDQLGVLGERGRGNTTGRTI